MTANEIERWKEEIEKETEVATETEKVWELEKVCPECGSPRLVTDHKRGEIFCQDCGLIVDEIDIDRSPEWRAFDNEGRLKRARTGPPLTYTLHDKGLSTVIKGNRDYTGKRLSSRNRERFSRLRRWQKSLWDKDRKLVSALSELSRIASSLGLPRNVSESASLIYRKASEKDLIKGRSRDAMVAAAIYAACRLAGVPRTLDEIANHSRVNKKEIGRAYRYIAENLNLKLTPLHPTDYVPKLCTTLRLSGKVQNKAIEIIKDAEKLNLFSGRSPVSIAAGAIYIAAILEDEKASQAEIGKAAGVTEVTVRNSYKLLASSLGIEVYVS